MEKNEIGRVLFGRTLQDEFCTVGKKGLYLTVLALITLHTSYIIICHIAISLGKENGSNHNHNCITHITPFGLVTNNYDFLAVLLFTKCLLIKMAVVFLIVLMMIKCVTIAFIHGTHTL